MRERDKNWAGAPGGHGGPGSRRTGDGSHMAFGTRVDESTRSNAGMRAQERVPIPGEELRLPVNRLGGGLKAVPSSATRDPMSGCTGRVHEHAWSGARQGVLIPVEASVTRSNIAMVDEFDKDMVGGSSTIEAKNLNTENREPQTAITKLNPAGQQGFRSAGFISTFSAPSTREEGDLGGHVGVDLRENHHPDEEYTMLISGSRVRNRRPGNPKHYMARSFADRLEELARVGAQGDPDFEPIEGFESAQPERSEHMLLVENRVEVGRDPSRRRRRTLAEKLNRFKERAADYEPEPAETAYGVALSEPGYSDAVDSNVARKIEKNRRRKERQKANKRQGKADGHSRQQRHDEERKQILPMTRHVVDAGQPEMQHRTRLESGVQAPQQQPKQAQSARSGASSDTASSMPASTMNLENLTFDQLWKLYYAREGHLFELRELRGSQDNERAAGAALLESQVQKDMSEVLSVIQRKQGLR